MLSSKLEKYKKLLNVQNWQIQLIEEECLDCDGHTKMLYNDYRAVIKISKSLSDTEKELSLIHVCKIPRTINRTNGKDNL